MPWSKRCGPVPRRRSLCTTDRGLQYLPIRYCTERLREVGIEPSVGSAGDSYDNALAEMIIGLYKTEVIREVAQARHVRPKMRDQPISQLW